MDASTDVNCDRTGQQDYQPLGMPIKKMHHANTVIKSHCNGMPHLNIPAVMPRTLPYFPFMHLRKKETKHLAVIKLYFLSF